VASTTFVQLHFEVARDRLRLVQGDLQRDEQALGADGGVEAVARRERDAALLQVARG